MGASPDEMRGLAAGRLESGTCTCGTNPGAIPPERGPGFTGGRLAVIAAAAGAVETGAAMYASTATAAVWSSAANSPEVVVGAAGALEDADVRDVREVRSELGADPAAAAEVSAGGAAFWAGGRVGAHGPEEDEELELLDVLSAASGGARESDVLSAATGGAGGSETLCAATGAACGSEDLSAATGGDRGSEVLPSATCGDRGSEVLAAAGGACGAEDLLEVLSASIEAGCTFLVIWKVAKTTGGLVGSCAGGKGAGLAWEDEQLAPCENSSVEVLVLGKCTDRYTKAKTVVNHATLSNR